MVRSIRFTEGQEVAKGAILLTLDETRLQAALEEAEASLKLSRQTHDRQKELLASRLVSQQGTIRPPPSWRWTRRRFRDADGS